jgi:hypothetical protein
MEGEERENTEKLNTYDRVPLRFAKLLGESLSTFLECPGSSQGSSGQIDEPSWV